MCKLSISVIISTYNRHRLLVNTIHSVIKQSIKEYEIIVVDNTCSEDTRKTVDRFRDSWANNAKVVKYVPEENIGLHNARHTGAKIAKGNILVFCDDDIVASRGWLEAISQSFIDKDVALVGGKVLPLYGEKPPCWLQSLWAETHYGRALGYLSLLDFGNKPKEIPPTYVYGCNFSIKKEVLYECGGFHPDSMPEDLIRFRGDGETAVAIAVRKKGYKAFYHPDALVYHTVTKGRMIPEYFCKRAFAQGISDSYTEIRKYGLDGLGIKIRRHLRSIKMFVQQFLKTNSRLAHCLRKSYWDGWRFHRAEVMRDPELLAWVQKPSYLESIE